MLIQNKRIAIIGGGPGGLAAAKLLQLQGAEITLYERDLDRNSRLVGSPLDMHEESGMAAIRKADLETAFNRNMHVRADRKIIVNEKAEVIFSDHKTGPDEPLSNEKFNPEIDRHRLRNLFLDALQPGTVEWDRHFSSLESKGAGWTIRFRNGSSAYADLVIAADGANSRVRPYITDIKAFYSGITMLELNIDDAKRTTPKFYQLLHGGKIMAFGNSRCILGGQKKDGLGFYASFKTEVNRDGNTELNFSDNEQLLIWFKKTYSGWSSSWDELFEKAALPFVSRPVYCMPPDQTWKALPNLTMLGDAAHVMPPFAGEGANTAMRDALDLSECLTSGHHHTLLEAITEFERRMRERASKAAVISLENGERMHSENALIKMLAATAY